MGIAIKLMREHFHTGETRADVMHLPMVDTADGWIARLFGDNDDAESMVTQWMLEALPSGDNQVTLAHEADLDTYIADNKIPASVVADCFNLVQVKYLQLQEARCAQSKDGDGRIDPNPDDVQVHSRWRGHADAHEGDPSCRPK